MRIRYRAYTIGPYIIRITGISHVATLNGVEVAYSQSRAGMCRMLKAHGEGETVRDSNGVDWTKGAYAS